MAPSHGQDKERICEERHTKRCDKDPVVGGRDESCTVVHGQNHLGVLAEMFCKNESLLL